MGERSLDRAASTNGIYVVARCQEAREIAPQTIEIEECRNVRIVTLTQRVAKIPEHTIT
jgi:hypothetical protein